MRDNLQAEALSEGNEGRVVRIGELLGYGYHRHSGNAGPSTCQIPVAAVRQGDDSSGSCVSVSYCRLVDDANSTLNLGFGPCGQCEHLVEAAQVRVERGKHEGPVNGRSGGQCQIAT